MIAEQLMYCVGARIVVEIFWQLFENIHYVNHIVIPPPGWKLEVLKILLTAMIAAPVVGSMH